MRVRSLPLLPTVLALAFAMLVALPVVAVGQSGLPATVSMYPAAAGPGDTVEVTGLDFPPQTTVVLELIAPSGRSTLGTVATGGDGSFRAVVSFPGSAAAGAWTVSGRSADGSVSAGHPFTSGGPAELASGPVTEAVDDPAAAVSSGTTTDKLVLVLIAVVLGAIATAGLYAWRLVSDDRSQPGMGAAEDLIWSGSTGEPAPEMTATDEPYWKQAAKSRADTVSDELEPATAREVPTSA